MTRNPAEQNQLLFYDTGPRFRGGDGLSSIDNGPDKMSEQTPRTLGRAPRGYAAIDADDQVDVTSYDSFPASDPPSWIATGIGSPQPEQSSGRRVVPDPRVSP